MTQQEQKAPVAQPPPTIQQFDPDLYYPGLTPGKLGVSVFLFGEIGTLKTTWACLWPSPVFLSVGLEGGDTSIAAAAKIYGIPTPPVYQITSTRTMVDKVEKICKNYKQWGIKTVVIDSATFYADLWISELIQGRVEGNERRTGRKGFNVENSVAGMEQRDWGFLETHMMKELAARLHGTELNVIWTALEKRVMDTQGTVTDIIPYLQGACATKLPGACSLVIYAERNLVPDPNVAGRFNASPTFWTSPGGKCKRIRHRFGNEFPEGKLIDPEFGTWPTFRAVDARIGQHIYK